MDKIRKFFRWMMIDPRHPELAQAQYNELKSQIPSLYALLMVNSIAVAYTHYDFAPFYLTVGILAPMLLVTCGRLFAWIRARNKVLGPEEAIAKMRQTVILGGLISAVFIAWSLSLDGYGGPTERGHVALFIAITVIGCIFCLMHLPQAAILVMAVVTVPYLIYYTQQGKDVYIAIALNIFLVCIVILQVLLNGYNGFCKLVRSQAALAVKQKETERLNAENERLAHTDALTELPNRRYFFNRLERRINEVAYSGVPFAVGIIDLDHFKRINDTFGHQAGDVVLKGFADRLRKELRAVDIAGRYGGEEFLVLFTGATNEEALEGAERFRAAMARDPFVVPGTDEPINVTVSAGISAGERGDDVEDVVARADAALYEAKSSGRNQVIGWRKRAA